MSFPKVQWSYHCDFLITTTPSTHISWGGGTMGKTKGVGRDNEKNSLSFPYWHPHEMRVERSGNGKTQCYFQIGILMRGWWWGKMEGGIFVGNTPANTIEKYKREEDKNYFLIE
jgi:hypothetical protein